MSNANYVPLLGQGHPSLHSPFDVCLIAAKENAVV